MKTSKKVILAVSILGCCSLALHIASTYAFFEKGTLLVNTEDERIDIESLYYNTSVYLRGTVNGTSDWSQGIPFKWTAEDTFVITVHLIVDERWKPYNSKTGQYWTFDECSTQDLVWSHKESDDSVNIKVRTTGDYTITAYSTTPRAWSIAAAS